MQSFRDRDGDKLRNRRTVSLAIGGTPAPWLVVIAVLLWSSLAPAFCHLGVAGFLLPVSTGLVMGLTCCPKSARGGCFDEKVVALVDPVYLLLAFNQYGIWPWDCVDNFFLYYVLEAWETDYVEVRVRSRLLSLQNLGVRKKMDPPRRFFSILVTKIIVTTRSFSRLLPVYQM